MNKTNEIWRQLLGELYGRPDYVSKPRGMEVREVINGTYKVPMPAYLNLIDRKVNLSFMFAEAAWIISGSNRLSDITPYMKAYKNYSDDGIFLRGAYGPKIVDQLGYVVDSIEKDNDTRQAVLNIWRERPGLSKDIPCTLNMQFLLRDGKLHLITNMRSHDIVLGFTYDVFSFSMCALSVSLLLKARGIQNELGTLCVNAGSMHIYEKHYEMATNWLDSIETNDFIEYWVQKLQEVETYEELISKLKNLAEKCNKEIK